MVFTFGLKEYYCNNEVVLVVRWGSTVYGRSGVNEKVEPAQLSLLRAAFIHCLTILFTRVRTQYYIRDSGNQHPISGDSVEAVSGTHARAC